MRRLDSKPHGLENYASQLFYARPEFRLGSLRVIPGTSPAEASPLLNPVGPPDYFVPSGAPDAVGLPRPEPHGFEDTAAELLDAGSERSLGHTRVRPCACLAYPIPLADIARTRRALMPSDTEDAVRPVSTEPFGFQDGAAELCYAGPEGGLNHARVKARATETDAAT